MGSGTSCVGPNDRWCLLYRQWTAGAELWTSAATGNTGPADPPSRPLVWPHHHHHHHRYYHIITNTITITHLGPAKHHKISAECCHPSILKLSSTPKRGEVTSHHNRTQQNGYRHHRPDKKFQTKSQLSVLASPKINITWQTSDEIKTDLSSPWMISADNGAKCFLKTSRPNEFLLYLPASGRAVRAQVQVLVCLATIQQSDSGENILYQAWKDAVDFY